jgi:hypothetical protein
MTNDKELGNRTTLQLSEEELNLEIAVTNKLPIYPGRKQTYVAGLKVLNQVLDAKAKGEKSIKISDIKLS